MMKRRMKEIKSLWGEWVFLWEIDWRAEDGRDHGDGGQMMMEWVGLLKRMKVKDERGGG